MSNVQRSKAYPSIDLGSAIERIKKFSDNLGSVGYHDRAEVAKGIGYTGINGASGRTIGALVHYGLLDRNKDKYGLSDISKTILFSYESEEEKQMAVREAALQPALFSELTHQYANNELPSLLSNILTSSQYGINPKVKDEVAEIYRATLAYAGMLKGSRVVLDESRADFDNDNMSTPVMTDDEGMAFDINEAGGNIPRNEPTYPVVNPPLDDTNNSLNKIEIFLREGVRAGIYAPYNLSEAEKTKLKSIIDLL